MSQQRIHDEMLERLGDALVEDILETSDEDILKEAATDYGDINREAERLRAVYVKSRATAAKKRLQSAQEAIKQQKERRGNVLYMDPKNARRKLDTLLRDHPDAASGLTLAARKGQDLSDEDVLGMLEDLEELGIGCTEVAPEPNR
jgi:hypothetical protein